MKQIIPTLSLLGQSTECNKHIDCINCIDCTDSLARTVKWRPLWGIYV